MTTPNYKSYLDDGRALVDARIAKMEESLRTLREERNTYSCAVRVPPEILTHIFLDVICDIYERDEEESIQQFYPPHVCRYWYEVASRSQQYWSYQRLADGELMPSHIIERAGGRPLHVWGYMSKYSPSCDFIRSQAESVKISTYGHSIPSNPFGRIHNEHALFRMPDYEFEDIGYVRCIHNENNPLYFYAPVMKSLLVYLVGACVYASQIPERWSPGLFDYVGGSHNIWHVAVLGGILFHYCAMQDLFAVAFQRAQGECPTLHR